MKTHTNTFKTNIKEFGRQIDCLITYTINGTTTTLTNEELNSIQPITQGDLLKSIMKELYIDSNIDIPKDTEIQFQLGVYNYTNEQFEYIDFGKYYVTKSEYQEDTRSYYITCYDKMINSMVDYEEVAMIYPTTVRSYINELCETIGLTFANASSTFANYDKEVPDDLYKDLGYTYRDVLDELAQVTASNICINANNQLEIRYITDTNDTVDEDYFSEDDVRFGKKIGKINSIVLSRSAESDNVYLRDEQSVTQNGLYEIKIIDNQIMNFNNRVDFLPDILARLDNLEFYSMDVKSTGICYYDICDRYTVSVNNNTYTCVLMNDEINIEQGIEENIYVEEPKVSETEYKYADSTDRRINQTYIIVNKQQGEIDAVVSAVEDIEQDIQNPTSTKQGTSIDITDALDSPLIDFKMYGDTQQDSTTGKNLFNPTYTFTNQNGVSSTISNQQITFNGTSTSAGAYIIADSNISSGTYTISLEIISGTHTTNKRIWFDFYNGNTKIDSGSLTTTGNFTKTFSTNITKINMGFDGSDAFTNLVFRVQLESGNSATDWEAYTGKSPAPNPDYPQDIHLVSGDNLIEICGKNLVVPFSYSRTNSGLDFTYNLDGSITVDKTSTGTAYAIANADVSTFTTLPAGTYTLSGGTNDIPIRFDDSTGTNIANTTSSTQFTLNQETKGYIQLRIGSGKTFNNVKVYPMIEKGSTASTYEAYTGYTQEINLGSIELCKISTYQDYIYKTNDKWYIHKEIGKVVLDGTNIAFDTKSGTTNNTMYSTTIISDIKKPSAGQVVSDILSNYFISKAPNTLYLNDTLGIGVNTNGTIACGFGLSSTLTTKELANTWLSTHNTIVYYVLNEPTETEITNSELVGQLENLMNTPLLKGLNHITNETFNLYPNLFIEYFRDTDINANFVAKEDMTKYYTKTETNSQITMTSSTIMGEVSRVEDKTDDNNEYIGRVETSVTNLQTDNRILFDFKQDVEQNGVKTLKNTLIEANEEGITISKTSSENPTPDFENTMSDKYQVIKSHGKEISFMGYDENENRNVARIDDIESKRAIIGVHRCETTGTGSSKRTAWFYVGGGN